MWKQSAKGYTDGEISKGDKQQQGESQVDSGFLSGSNLISSELSIDSENEERQDEPEVAPEPVKAIKSGLDLGLSDSLNQLSLKEATLDILDSGTVDPELEELSSREIKNEQEPWESYYMQDDENGDTKLHVSIVEGDLELAFLIISMAPHPCLLNILNDHAATPLHLAVFTHQPTIVRRLILAGADPTIRNFTGNTPLHIACILGDLYCANALTTPFTSAELSWLKPGEKPPMLPQNLEQRNYTGEMCLHLAADKGHVEIVRQLIRAGADVDAREGLGGRTPLHLAIENRRSEIIQVLLDEFRPKLDAQTYGGLTAYHLACETDSQLASKLVRLGATPSLPPELDSDSDESESEEEDSPGYVMSLARLGMTAVSTA